MWLRGVIFDLGHTLMHLNGTWPQMFERGAAGLRAYVDDLGLDGEAFARAWLSKRAQAFQAARTSLREVPADQTMQATFRQLGVPDPALDEVRGALDAFFAPEVASWAADPSAVRVLRTLAGRGLRLGMFSNATHDPLIQGLVDTLGFRFWLLPALSSASTLVRKPDPLAFQPILNAWRLPPSDVVVVGDRLDADILGAQRADMRGVWLRSRPDARQESDAAAPPPEPVEPDAVIDRLSDLPAVLDAWRTPGAPPVAPAAQRP
jgi:HAD superfamily hydrolase (TIGR01549 family)